MFYPLIFIVFALATDPGDLTYLLCVLGLNQSLKDVFTKEPSVLMKSIKQCLDWKEVHYTYHPYPFKHSDLI